MELDPKIEQELRRVLSAISSTRDLEDIASQLGLDEQFDPVITEARRTQGISLPLLSNSPRIRELRTRVKTLNSTLFKMLYCRKSDLNRVNDIVGFIAVVDRLDDCYELLSELVGEGLKPSFRVCDSLDRPDSEYRSIDANFTFQGHYFQVQIRTTGIQQVYDQGPLTPTAYKERRFRKLKQYLSGNEFGIDYRIALFESIVHNFHQGHTKVKSEQV